MESSAGLVAAGPGAPAGDGAGGWALVLGPSGVPVVVVWDLLLVTWAVPVCEGWSWSRIMGPGPEAGTGPGADVWSLCRRLGAGPVSPGWALVLEPWLFLDRWILEPLVGPEFSGWEVSLKPWSGPASVGWFLFVRLGCCPGSDAWYLVWASLTGPGPVVETRPWCQSLGGGAGAPHPPVPGLILSSTTVVFI